MQVEAALIVMSIMGCDDTGSQCVALAQNQADWKTISQCDEASNDALNQYSNANYPVIIAVCQTETVVAAPEGSDQEQNPELAEFPPPPPPPVEEQEPRTLVEMMSNLSDKAAPITDSVKSVLIDKPVHVVKDSYSWVVKKLR